jgi:hypothetical protein
MTGVLDGLSHPLPGGGVRPGFLWGSTFSRFRPFSSSTIIVTETSITDATVSFEIVQSASSLTGTEISELPRPAQSAQGTAAHFSDRRLARIRGFVAAKQNPVFAQTQGFSVVQRFVKGTP